MIRLLPLLLLAACEGAAPAPEPPAASRPLVERVGWGTAEPATAWTLVTVPAEVVSPPGGLVEVTPRVPVRLAAWRVRQGDAVAAGDVLAVVDAPELAGLTDAVAARRRVVDAEQARLDAGLGTAADAAAARAEAASLTARVEAARGSVDRRGGSWVWRAPRDGVVAELLCHPGEHVDEGESCLTLVDPTAAEVRVRVPEKQLGALDGVRLRYVPAEGEAALLDPVRRAPTLDPVSRTLTMWFAASDEASWAIPGASGRGDLIAPAPAGAWALPPEAVTRLDGVDHVFVRVGDEARARQVDVVGRGPGVVVLAPDALAASDRVAVEGVFLLKSATVLSEEG